MQVSRRCVAVAVACCGVAAFQPPGAAIVAQSSGCELAAERFVAPERARVGEPISVTVRLSASSGCAGFRRPRRVMAVFQPPRPTEALSGAAALADAFIAGVLGTRGRIGIAVAGPRQPDLLPPGVDDDGFRNRLRSANPLDATRFPGEPGPQAIQAALDAFAPTPGFHDVVYYVAHQGALAETSMRWSAARERAAERGIELVTVCLGGGCDPGTAWTAELADYPALAAALAGPLLAGAPTPLRAVASAVLEERTDAAFGEASAASPAPASQGVRLLRWDLPIAAGEAVEVRYRLDALTWGARAPAAGTVRWQLHSPPDGPEHHELEAVAAPPVMVALPKSESCELAAGREVHPARVRLGDPVTVTIGLGAECLGTMPIDVVMVLDVSGSMDGVKLAAAREGLAAMIDRLAPLPVRAALVTFDVAVREQVGFTTDLMGLRARVVAQASTGGQTRLAKGLDAAGALLADRVPDAAALVVVATDGASTDTSAIDVAADAITRAGAGTAVICPLGSCSARLRALASDESLVFEGADAAGLAPRLDALGARLAGPETRSVLVEELPAVSFLPLPDGAVSPALVGGAPGVLRWRVGIEARVLRYRAEPLLLGRQQTLRAGSVHLRSALGFTRTVVLPDPWVETFVDEGTGPCDIGPRRTANAARVAVGEPITVTMSVAFACPEPPGDLDAVLVVDHSDSMRALDRLDNAKAAVAAFVGGLQPGRARIGLVAFSDRVTREVPLTDDFASVQAAVDGLRPDGGTAIGAALRRAAILMGQRRPDVGAAVILLTDGREPAGSDAPLRAAALALTSAGIELATVCAGDCGPDLAGLASRPELAFDRVESAQLVGLFERLAGLVIDVGSLGQIVIRDGLPSAVVAEPDAYAPPPEMLASHEARWRFDRLGPSRALTLTYAVRPVVPGRVVLSRYARVDYRFGRDQLGHGWFQIPVVDVEGSSATPTAVIDLTHTPTPIATAAATNSTPQLPQPVRARLWLPFAATN